MKRSKNLKKYIVAIFSIIIILVIIAILYNFNKESSPIAKKEKVENKLDLTEVKANYNNYVKVQDKSNLYQKKDNKYEKVSTINGSIEISLDPNYEITDEYFKLLNNDYYVKYNEVQTIESLTPKSEEYKYYKNYIPYNENIELKNNAKLYIDANNYYEVPKSSYPIIIKDNNQYGIEYNNELVYVNKTDVEHKLQPTLNNTHFPAPLYPTLLISLLRTFLSSRTVSAVFITLNSTGISPFSHIHYSNRFCIRIFICKCQYEVIK